MKSELIIFIGYNVGDECLSNFYSFNMYYVKFCVF